MNGFGIYPESQSNVKLMKHVSINVLNINSVSAGFSSDATHKTSGEVDISLFNKRRILLRCVTTPKEKLFTSSLFFFLFFYFQL
jgi:hypothetical protein